MIIGIDVDGVLVDMELYQIKYGTRYFQKKYNKEIVNPKGYDIQDIFDCTVQEREEFWTKYIWKYCLKEPMTLGAAETVNKLRKQGHKIYIVTGRAHTTEKGIVGMIFRWMLKSWLKKNHFKYDKIFFCAERDSSTDKFDVCIREKVDVLVDDKPENLLALKNKIQVICYPAAWNEDRKELNEYRINKFEKISGKIQRD